MTNLMQPGKLSYIEIPASDTAALGGFYREVFGWQVRDGSPDHVGFQDASGELIGAFTTRNRPGAEPGILPYISVMNVEEVLARIATLGGATVRAPYPEGNLTVATFRDPAGNVVGIWNMPGE